MSFSLAFSHVGIFVTDLEQMIRFYTQFLGFAISDREPSLRGGEICFLTRDSRVVERKKYGKKKARRSFQFSKR